MQKVLDDLNEKRRGETGWTEREDFKVKEAVVLLKVAIKKLDCTPSQSYPRP